MQVEPDPRSYRVERKAASCSSGRCDMYMYDENTRQQQQQQLPHVSYPAHNDRTAPLGLHSFPGILFQGTKPPSPYRNGMRIAKPTVVLCAAKLRHPGARSIHHLFQRQVYRSLGCASRTI